MNPIKGRERVAIIIEVILIFVAATLTVFILANLIF
jgi:hypothetical protein